MARAQELDVLISLWAHRLHLPPESVLDPVRVLKALAWKESTYGQNTTPLKEPAYLPGGRYFTPEQAARHKKYGVAAAKSYSSFQILYPTACELGFSGTPTDLDDDREAIRWVVELLNRRVFGRDHAMTIEEVGDCYNSGRKGGFLPAKYMQELRGYYDRLT
jgi:hypothetical protein